MSDSLRCTDYELCTDFSKKHSLLASALHDASGGGVGQNEAGVRQLQSDRRARTSSQAAEIIRKPERRTSSYRAA